MNDMMNVYDTQCVKSVTIQSYSDPHFSRIPHSDWILRISPYSVQRRENVEKIRTSITANTDIFKRANDLVTDIGVCGSSGTNFSP